MKIEVSKIEYKVRPIYSIIYINIILIKKEDNRGNIC